MKKAISILVAGLFFTGSAMCQLTAKTPGKIKFSSINQVGLLTGGSGQSAAIQTINGVTKNTWFAGVGAGIDYYGTRGVPLFVDVRKELFSRKNTPFVYADGGVHIPWATDQQKANKGYQATSGNGAYFDGGIGMKLQTKNIGAILFSAGFSYKQVKEKAEMFSFWSFPTPEPTYEYYNYKYRRIVVKVGIQL